MFHQKRRLLQNDVYRIKMIFYALSLALTFIIKSINKPLSNKSLKEIKIVMKTRRHGYRMFILEFFGLQVALFSLRSMLNTFLRND